MPDREKVIKGLHCCSHTDGVNCIYCPYDISDTDCTALMAMDVLALLKEQEEEIENLKQTAQSMMEGICLLKEQEAVEPILKREGRNKYYNYYVCPRCNEEVVYDQNYCSECGAKFMWEGR